MGEEVLPTKQSNTPIQKCMRPFQGQEKRFLQIILKNNAKYFNFDYFKKWQLSNSNTKVCFNDEILKTTNAPK